LRRTLKRIIVGTEVFRHGALALKGVVEHSAKGDAVDGAVHGKGGSCKSLIL
jgi:hypothetical protein